MRGLEIWPPWVKSAALKEIFKKIEKLLKNQVNNIWRQIAYTLNIDIAVLLGVGEYLLSW